AAISALPANGGEVCVLPGRYFENVLIQGRRDIVIHGCGWQTRIASASLKPPTPPAAGGPPDGVLAGAAPAPPGSTVKAVITISESEHVELLSFAVEAARDEVGVLVDGTGTLRSGPATVGTNEVRSAILQRARTVDVTLEDLILTASTFPAILADRVTLLQIERNRVAMENVRSQWPAVWVSGREIRVVRSWLGIRSTAADREWLPVTVAQDLGAAAGGSASGTIGPANVVPLHPGGLQIGGPSVDVFVLANEIDGAGSNGITLGSVSILDPNGRPTGQVTGVTIEVPGPCDTTITLTIPGSTSGGQDGGKIVASGKLRNIQINRNRIRNTGLCGIGPVGFFNFAEQLEVISVENLTIASNTIASTLMQVLAQPAERLSSFGYGAICLPDVEGPVIRDNSITDFGREAGDAACGIFVLHGEMAEISRNHVLETRDWTQKREQQPADGLRGGIVLLL